MEQIEFRAVIKFLTKQGKPLQTIMNEMETVYGDQCPGKTMIYKWHGLFKNGRESIEDDPRPGRPVEATTSDNVEKIEKFILEDARLKKKQLSALVGVSDTTILRILHDHLGMTKVSARWVPRMLTPPQKQQRIDASKHFLELCGAEPTPILEQIVTGDETWVHHFEPESKQESMQWHKKGTPPPKKFKVSESAGKIMATVFWDCEGILLVDYKEKGVNITREYYARTLERLKEAVKEKRRGKWTKGVLLLQDNAPVHKSNVAMAALHKCGFQSLTHPPYSPDLAPSDYYLFPNLKKDLRGNKFRDDEEVKA
ncbi:histone-lysine N-methyltransferase SETMAR-like, partial [Hyposmocoma kahamanoa]|uniref:histone-lysine N-methyltransferase SETMAR-like n=1 Tax=Hyposmocoma kahamanoa TaxID=1477025 RepID=UPI000E6D9F4A